MKPTRRIPTIALSLGLAALSFTATAGADAGLAEALDGDRRSAPDRARDAGRHPAQVISFLGIGRGDRVIDLIAAGGYYTEVLSVAVGEKGHVYAQNPPAVLRFRDGANDKAMTSRLAGGRLPNVVRVDVDLAEAPIEPASLDAAITALNFHDVYDSRGEEAAAAFLASAYRLLKPGGVLGLIDHVGVAGADNATLHRIEESKVRALVEASPFALEASSDLLRNPEDDHTRNVFDPELRGKTDRFLWRLRKPK
jgi:predicted methyltransferase